MHFGAKHIIQFAVSDDEDFAVAEKLLRAGSGSVRAGYVMVLYLFYTGAASAKEITLYFRANLPAFMVPRKLVNLEQMPRLANGKTDMEKLKEYFK